MSVQHVLVSHWRKVRGEAQRNSLVSCELGRVNIEYRIQTVGGKVTTSVASAMMLLGLIDIMGNL
jgi:hypothetical protein